MEEEDTRDFGDQMDDLVEDTQKWGEKTCQIHGDFQQKDREGVRVEEILVHTETAHKYFHYSQLK